MTNVFWYFSELVSDIERNGMDGINDHWIFMWDNLLAHLMAYIHKTPTSCAGPSRFLTMPQRQYHLKFGPIKYICEVTSRARIVG
jgi:hypothetical protein